MTWPLGMSICAQPKQVPRPAFPKRRQDMWVEGIWFSRLISKDGKNKQILCLSRLIRSVESVESVALKAHFIIISQTSDRYASIRLHLNEKRVNIYDVQMTSQRLRVKSSQEQEKQKSLNAEILRYPAIIKSMFTCFLIEPSL